MSSASASAPARGGLAVLIALSLVYVVWGSTYLAIRFALEGGFPPLLMAGIRFLIAGALMYAVLRLRGMAAPTRAQWGYSAVMGAPGPSPARCTRATEKFVCRSTPAARCTCS